MKGLKTPTLPKELLFARKEKNTLLARTAKAIASVPKPEQEERNSLQAAAGTEATATLVYLAEVFNGFFAKLEELRPLPLADFSARMEAYVAETAAALPEEVRPAFMARAEVYTRGAQAELNAMEEAENAAVSNERFVELLDNLEQAATDAAALPDGVQAETIAAAVADYRNALEGGEAAGLLAEGSAELMLEDLRQDMAAAAVAKNVADSPEPAFLALLIASGKTGVAEVDGLDGAVRQQLLENTLKQEGATS